MVLRRDIDDWYKPRSYLHFDRSLGKCAINTYLRDEQKILSHSFWPFIKYSKRQKRFWQYSDPENRQVNYKERPIMYASHMDAHILSFYSYTLQGPYEKYLVKAGLDEVVTAYRKLGKCNIHFAKDVFDYIDVIGDCDVLCCDVKSFFDTLDHGLLKIAWAKVLNVPRLPDDHFAIFMAITKYSWVQRNELYKCAGITSKASEREKQLKGRICSACEFRRLRENGLEIQRNNEGKGIPQGSPISSTLANIYMMEFDRELNDYVSKHGGKYWRYADDVLVVMPKGQLSTLKDKVEELTAALKLELSRAKTEEVQFRNGAVSMYKKGGTPSKGNSLQYLGFTYDGSEIRIRNKSVANYYRKIDRAIRRGCRGAHFHNPRSTVIPRKQFFKKYATILPCTFLAYAQKAANIMESDAIMRQVRHNRTFIIQKTACEFGKRGGK